MSKKEKHKDKHKQKSVKATKIKGKKEKGDIIEKIQEKNNSPVHTTEVETKQKDIKKATFELDAKLHKRLRGAAVQYETTMVELVEKAINEYLDKLDNQ